MSDRSNKNKALSELGMLFVVLVLTSVFLITDAYHLRADTGELNGSARQNMQNAMQEITENASEQGEPENSYEQTPEEGQENIQESLEDVISESDSETDDEQETQPESQLTSLPEFVQAPEGYFDDALFIGDSRTVGLSEYGGIEGADFFATTGMSVYNIDGEKVRLGDKGVISFDNLITQYSYGKIYLMLGINELGYDKDETINEYKALVERLRQAQPDAIIFVEANLHVSAKRSATDAIYNNENINYINENISALADNEKIFYHDVNILFDDENGNLRADTTMDETHVLGRYYKQWADWLAENAIVK